MVTIYGIKNCDTMKKAFDWLEDQGIDYTFHNYREEGLNKALLKKWLKQLPLSQLVNNKSTTWRQLSEAEQKSVSDADKAIELMMAHHTLIKRPVLDIQGRLLLGFKPEEWELAFASSNS